jgi:hypothetical protein
MNDTRPEITRMMHQKLMARSGEERFLMGVRMCEAARSMVLASFPKDLSDAERRRRLRLRYYASEV